MTSSYYPQDAGESPHTSLLASEFVSFDEETQTATMRFTVKPEMTTWRGGVQGGLVAGYLDDVMGYAFVAATGGELAPLNLELSMSLIRLIPEGATIIGKGRVVKAGFVSDVPGSYFHKRFKGSVHPFCEAVYEEAAKIHKKFAGNMDTCIPSKAILRAGKEKGM